MSLARPKVNAGPLPGQERRLAALVQAARRMEQAANIARVTVHELAAEDLQGAVDVANRALYELARASETLLAQWREYKREAKTS